MKFAVGLGRRVEEVRNRKRELCQREQILSDEEKNVEERENTMHLKDQWAAQFEKKLTNQAY